MDQVTIKPGDTLASLGSRAKGFLSRMYAGVDTSREDKLSQNIVNQAKKSKNSASFRAYKDVVKGTPPRRGLAKLAARAGKAISKTPKGALVAAGLVGAVAGARTIGKKFSEIRKNMKDAAITKQVDKYVADRKIPGGPKKVNYKPTNQYTVTRDSKGKVTGTGKLIRVVPGTEFKEETMTPAQKRKDTMLKKKYEKSDDMMKSFKDQYGKEKGENVFYAFIRKKSMEEALNKDDEPKLKKLHKMLLKSSDSHKKQAKLLAKSIKEQLGGTGPKVAPSSEEMKKKLTKTVDVKTVDTNKKIPPVTGLGGGGGGTNAITMKAKGKTLKNRIKDVGKLATVPFRAALGIKSKPDPTEKFATEDTAIESELTIQDWNVDDIKFTEIETVDIIKAKPLKESMSNWRDELDEDWQKVNRKDKTDGLSQKAVNAYRRENPGSKLKTAVTKDPKKLKKGSKSAKRRLSFCRRMKGMKKKLTSAKTSRDPDSRINKALRRWNC